MSLPGLGWDAMLKITGVSLHLFTPQEVDMYLMMEEGKIGGISTIGGKRYGKAYNHFIKGFDKSLKHFIQFLDLC